MGSIPAIESQGIEVVMYAKGGPSRFKKNYGVQCDFCKMKGHTKDVFYKLIGYPADCKFKKRGSNSGYGSGVSAHNVMADNHFQDLDKGSRVVLESGYSEASTSQVQPKMGPYPFTKEHYNQILALLKGEGNVGIKTNVAASGSLAGSLKWKSEGGW